MNRRAFLGSLVTLPALLNSAAAEQSWCINPWRQARKGDAIVGLSQIKSALFVDFPLTVDEKSGGWLQVETYAGDVIQSELESIQPDIRRMRSNMESAGIVFETFPNRK